MNDNSTDFGRYSRLSEQGPAFEALTALEVMLPSLPPAYFTIHEASYGGVDAQLNTVADFEAWRVALQIPTDAVNLHGATGGGWLSADTVVRGVRFHIAGHGLAITREQAAPPVRPVQVVTLADAVAEHGPFPMPTGVPDPCRPCGCPTRFNRHADGCPDPTPLPGELAEQRHMRDELDHQLEHLADERPTVSLPVQLDRRAAL